MHRTPFRAVAAAGTLAAALVVATTGSAATHQPIYMPNVQNVHSPALQPPPVCCAAAGERIPARRCARPH